jgi:phosphohistidine phosphatase
MQENGEQLKKRGPIMKLYLMQHGQANPSDIEEGLSDIGTNTIYSSAMALKYLGIDFDVIISSNKKRATMTAAIVAEVLSMANNTIICSDAFKPMSPAEDSIKFLQDYIDKKNILITGHLPSLKNISSYLLSSNDDVSIKFVNGGCCCLEIENFYDRTTSLEFLLTAKQLNIIANVDIK